VDGDGDADVLSASNAGESRTAWYENTDGKGNFGQERVIALGEGKTNSVHSVDLDGDGDFDVLSAFTDKVVWQENTNRRGTFGPEHVITVTGGNSVQAGDVDGDSDQDVVIASPVGVVWYENNGRGGFGIERLTALTASGVTSISVVDIDGDGNMDVVGAVYASGAIAWYEQRLVGDANDDGVFNSSDLVQVVQAGKYEDGNPASNATFDEGDWNGDGVFNSGDIVVAFQAGHYEQAAAALPIDCIFVDDECPSLRNPNLENEINEVDTVFAEMGLKKNRAFVA
jgi:hypothetical protein